MPCARTPPVETTYGRGMFRVTILPPPRRVCGSAICARHAACCAISPTASHVTARSAGEQALMRERVGVVPLVKT